MNASEKDIDRFFAKFKEGPYDQCWLWTASKSSTGQGAFFADGSWIAAHRFAYEYWTTEKPDKLNVIHTCGVPHCVNPHHLFLGDEKVRGEQTSKNGNFNRKGSNNGNSKLTEEEVKAMRLMHKTGKYNVRTIGKVFSISESSASRILRNITWSSLD